MNEDGISGFHNVGNARDMPLYTLEHMMGMLYTPPLCKIKEVKGVPFDEHRVNMEEEVEVEEEVILEKQV
ncbi:hypothetical protein RHMOL_Rhmol02G0217200 [Rhododendron molle]|uniref:Uncharacterized protein n=1 Tax=Rhododendron molle TaxID=49168 RepID=A0ACC0PSE4_RHOML|nr:hypothetical protein RHMOL_Rhmol02G0217200 [Rhododendron molle]